MQDLDFERNVQHFIQLLQVQIKKHWFKTTLFAIIVLMTMRKDLSINLKLNASQWTENEGFNFAVVDEVKAMNTSLLETKKPKAIKAAKNVPDHLPQPANTFSNMTFTGTPYESKDSSKKKAEKRKKQEQYIKRYAKVAQAEMDKYGIPASITLAQGLLESNAGESKLAVKNNNHFGMKCFSRKCKKGHCSNFQDDSHKDFFRIYESSWESFRAHSQLLKAKRYAALFKLNKNDYKSWAHGLKKAGYATDKNYGYKLINLIEDLKLHQYD